MFSNENLLSIGFQSVLRGSQEIREYISVTPLPIFLNWRNSVLLKIIVGHCATNRKVVGSIPDGVTGIFHWHNPSGRTVAMGLNRPLTEMSTRNISLGGKGGRCVRLTTLPPSCAVVTKSGNLNLLEPSGPLQACNGISPIPYINAQLNKACNFS